jgi:hypothetical protein
VSERKNNEMKEMKEKIRFLNVTFKVRRNPNYKGNHNLATVNSVMGNTFPLGTTEKEMTNEFLGETVVKDINGKTWTKGEMLEVVEIEKCFEDSSIKGRFHKDNY